jgi:DNA-binding NarL/FixJ family response regulator
MTSELLGEPHSQRQGERQMTRVILVEDHAAFRDALSSLLNMQPDLEVVGRTGSLAEGRAALAAEEVDVAVVDVFLPDGNGLGLVRELRQADPHLPIVILTAGLDPEIHALALEAGADEVCLKATGIEEILKAIRGVAPDR